MRRAFWRRAVAVLAMLIGLGIGASSVTASATPTHGSHTAKPADWWW